MMPDKIGGRPGKPGLSVTVISAKPRRGGMPDSIGGEPGGYEDEGDEAPLSNEQAMDDAASEAIAAITSIKPNPKRLKEALRAFVQACNPSNEGEEIDDEEEGI